MDAKNEITVTAAENNPKNPCKNRKIYVREEELLEQFKAELLRYTVDEEIY